MDDRYVRLESTVEQLRLTVGALQRRVEALETGSARASQVAARPVSDDATQCQPTARAQRDPYDPIVILTLIGRLFLVLAGGFFLRAMTEAGVLAAPVGVGLALVYALVWLVFADRAGAQGQPSGALFHVIAAALVAFPLLIEATTRFKVIGVAGSVLGLLILTAAFLAVAARRRIHVVAWIAVVAALPTSAILALKTGVAAPYVLYLIALGVATVWLAYSYGWTLIRWPVALACDFAVAVETFRALAPAHAESSRVVVLLQIVLVVAYLGSIAVRTLLRDRNVTLFEISQSVLALVIGFGGAVLLTRGAEAMPVAMGLASLVFGAACYVLAFKFVGRHEGHEHNVHFYMSLALLLMLAGLTLDLPPAWMGTASGLFAVLAAWGWSRHGRPDLLAHAALYVAAAAVATGALAYATWSLLASPDNWVPPATLMALVVLVSAFSAYFAAGRPRPEGGVAASGLRFALALALVWVASGWATGYLGFLAARTTDGTVDLGALATVRTGVLAVATLLVAAVARRERFYEWAWMVYPMLVFTGLKMVGQDFKHSRPATLFIALALFGVALILAPRLRRSARRPEQTAQSRERPVETA